MKNLIIGLVIISLVVGGVIIYNNLQEKPFGVMEIANEVTLIGSSDNLRSLPASAVFADSTTTNDVIHADPGATLQQAFQTEGFDEIELNIFAVGAVSTSTMNIIQMASTDGINYYDISSTTEDLVGTSAFRFIAKKFTSDPGTATTSLTIPFDVKGSRYTRFIIWSEPVGDFNTGTQAWITLTKVSENSR